MSYQTRINLLSSSIHGCLRQPARLARYAGFGALVAPFAVLANPTGGQVVAGQAGITDPDANHTIINQASQSAIINWQQFSIGSDQYVQFIQPDSSSVVLNRVIGGDPSSILGTLKANGQVFLVNPNGVFFGQGAKLDVQGLVASTLDINDSDFMAGHYVFSKGTSSTGKVINQGNIQAHAGGYVVLAGDYVENDGIISATAGHVVLASGAATTLTLDGNSLVSYAVNQATLDQYAGAQNAGTLNADGGTVVMTAAVANQLKATVVNNTGLIEAHSAVAEGGAIYLTATGGDIENSGTLDASATQSGAAGGTVVLKGDGATRLAASSKLLATGDNADGGHIEVSGNGLTLRGITKVGAHGSVLLDPVKASIVSGSSNTASGTGASAVTHIGVGYIETQLDSNADVTIQAAAYGSLNPASITANAAAKATGLQATGTGNLTLTVVNGGSIKLSGFDIKIGGALTAGSDVSPSSATAKGFDASFGHITARSVDINTGIGTHTLTLTGKGASAGGGSNVASIKSTGGNITITTNTITTSGGTGLSLNAASGGTHMLGITGQIGTSASPYTHNVTLTGRIVDDSSDIYGSRNVTVNATSGWMEVQTIDAGKNISLTALSAITAGNLSAGSDLSLTAGASISASDMTAGGDLTVTAGSGISAGSLSANGDITLTNTGAGDVTVNRVYGGNVVSISATSGNVSFDGSAGTDAHAGKNLAITATGVIAPDGDLKLTAVGNINVSGVFEANATGSSLIGLTLSAGATLHKVKLDHSIFVDEALTIKGGSLQYLGTGSNFSLAAGNDLNIDANIVGANQNIKLMTRAGAIHAQDVVTTGTFTASAGTSINGADVSLGHVTASGITIQAGSSSSGLVTLAGVGPSAGGVSNAASLKATSGNIVVHAGSITTGTGGGLSLNAAGSVDVTGSIGSFSSGFYTHNVVMSGKAIDDNGGIFTTGRVTLNASYGAISVGSISAGKTVALTALSDIGVYGAINAGSSVMLNAGNISASDMTAGGDLTVTAGSGISAGSLSANGDITLTNTGAGDVTVNRVYGGNVVSISATSGNVSFDGSAGTDAHAGKNLAITATDILAPDGDLKLTAVGNINVSGVLEKNTSGSDLSGLTLSAGTTVHKVKLDHDIAVAGDLTIKGGSLQYLGAGSINLFASDTLTLDANIVGATQNISLTTEFGSIHAQDVQTTGTFTASAGTSNFSANVSLGHVTASGIRIQAGASSSGSVTLAGAAHSASGALIPSLRATSGNVFINSSKVATGSGGLNIQAAGNLSVQGSIGSNEYANNVSLTAAEVVVSGGIETEKTVRVTASYGTVNLGSVSAGSDVFINIAGSTAAQMLSVTAGGNINITDTAGDLQVGSIHANTGSAVLNNAGHTLTFGGSAVAGARLEVDADALAYTGSYGALVLSAGADLIVNAFVGDQITPFAHGLVLHAGSNHKVKISGRHLVTNGGNIAISGSQLSYTGAPRGFLSIDAQAGSVTLNADIGSAAAPVPYQVAITGDTGVVVERSIYTSAVAGSSATPAILLEASSGNVTIGHGSSQAVNLVATAGPISVNAGDSITVGNSESDGPITISAGSGNLSMSAGDNLVVRPGVAFTSAFGSSKNAVDKSILLHAAQSVRLIAGRQIELAQGIAEAFAGSSGSASATADLTVTAGKNILLQGGSTSLSDGVVLGNSASYGSYAANAGVYGGAAHAHASAQLDLTAGNQLTVTGKQVVIHPGSADAVVYGGSGDADAVAITDVALTAGANIFVGSSFGVYLYGGFASAFVSASSGHANAEAGLTLNATGNIVLSGFNVGVGAGSAWAQASAYGGVAPASADASVTLTANDIDIYGYNVGLAGGNATLRATVSSSGSATAAATANLTLAAASDVSIGANYASISAGQYVAGGSSSSSSPPPAFVRASSQGQASGLAQGNVLISAGHGISVSGYDITLEDGAYTAYGAAVVAQGSGAKASLLAEANVSLTAGNGGISFVGYGGTTFIGSYGTGAAYLTEVFAQAGASASASIQNNISLNATGADITAGNSTVDLNTAKYGAGYSAEVSASGSRSRAQLNVDDNVSLDADNISIFAETLNLSGGQSNAYDAGIRAYGDLAQADATLNSRLSINASGNLTLQAGSSGSAGVFITGGGSNAHGAYMSGGGFGASVNLNADAGVSLTAGGDMTLLGGSVYIEAGSSLGASFHGNASSGADVNASLAAGVVLAPAGQLSIQASAGGLNILGGEADNSSSSVMSLAIYGGPLPGTVTVQRTDGVSASASSMDLIGASVDIEGGTDLNGTQIIAGHNATISLTDDFGVSLTATNALSISGSVVGIFGGDLAESQHIFAERPAATAQVTVNGGVTLSADTLSLTASTSLDGSSNNRLIINGGGSAESSGIQVSADTHAQASYNADVGVNLTAVSGMTVMLDGPGSGGVLDIGGGSEIGQYASIYAGHGGQALFTAQAGVNLEVTGASGGININTDRRSNAEVLIAGGGGLGSHASVHADPNGLASLDVAGGVNISAPGKVQIKSFAGGVSIIGSMGRNVSSAAIIAQGAGAQGGLHEDGGVSISGSTLFLNAASGVTIVGIASSVECALGCSAEVGAIEGGQADMELMDTVQLTASGDLTVQTAGGLYMSAGRAGAVSAEAIASHSGASAQFHADSSVMLTGANISLDAVGPVTMNSGEGSGLGNNVLVRAVDDAQAGMNLVGVLSINAGQNLTVSAGSALIMSGAWRTGRGADVQALGTDASAGLSARSTLTMQAGGSISLSATGVIAVAGGGQVADSVYLSASGSGALATANLKGNVNIAAAGVFSAAGSTVLLRGGNQNASHAGASAGGSGSVDIGTKSGLLITAGSIALQAGNTILVVAGESAGLYGNIAAAPHGKAGLDLSAGVTLDASAGSLTATAAEIAIHGGGRTGNGMRVAAYGPGASADWTISAGVALNASTALGLSAGSSLLLSGGTNNAPAQIVGGGGGVTYTGNVNTHLTVTADGDVNLVGATVAIRAGTAIVGVAGSSYGGPSSSSEGWRGGTLTFNEDTGVSVSAGQDLLISGSSLRVQGAVHSLALIAGGSANATATLNLSGDALLSATHDLTLNLTGNASIGGGTGNVAVIEDGRGALDVIQSADGKLYAGHDVILSSLGGNLTVSGMLAGLSSSTAVRAEAFGSSQAASLHASAEATGLISAGNDITTASAIGGDLMVAGGGTTAYLTGYVSGSGAGSAQVTTDASLHAGHDVTLQVTGSLEAIGGQYEIGTAQAENGTITLSARAGISAGSAVTLSAADMTIAGGDNFGVIGSLFAASGANEVVNGDASADISGASISLTAANSLLIRGGVAARGSIGASSEGHAQLTADTGVQIAASGDLDITVGSASHGTASIFGGTSVGLQVEAFANGANAVVNADLKSGVSLSAGGNLDLNVGGVLTVVGAPQPAGGSSTYAEVIASGSSAKATVAVDGRVGITAGNNLNISMGGGDLSIAGGSRGGQFLFVGAAGSGAQASADVDTRAQLQAGGALTVTGANNVTLSAGAFANTSTGPIASSSSGGVAKVLLNSSVELTGTSITIGHTGAYTTASYGSVVSGGVTQIGLVTLNSGSGSATSAMHPTFMPFVTRRVGDGVAHTLTVTAGTVHVVALGDIGNDSVFANAAQMNPLATLQQASLLPSLSPVVQAPNKTSLAMPLALDSSGVDFTPILFGGSDNSWAGLNLTAVMPANSVSYRQNAGKRK